jgi:ATP dependent DNA ligase domain
MRRCSPHFVLPCIPSFTAKIPTGSDWVHEPKFDGWRIQVVKDGGDVKLYTRTGRDCSRRVPALIEGFRSLAVRSCIIDGELIADEDDRAGDIWTRPRRHGSATTAPVVASTRTTALRSWPLPGISAPGGCIKGRARIRTAPGATNGLALLTQRRPQPFAAMRPDLATLARGSARSWHALRVP